MKAKRHYIHLTDLATVSRVKRLAHRVDDVEVYVLPASALSKVIERAAKRMQASSDMWRGWELKTMRLTLDDYRLLARAAYEAGGFTP